MENVKDTLAVSGPDSFSREAVLTQFHGVSPQIGGLARRTLELTPPEEGDAVAVFLGLGEAARLEAAVDLWRDGAYRHLLIGGVNPIEDDHPSPEELVARVEALGGTRLKDVHILPEARHTKDQADWLAHTASELQTRRLVLVDPDYHVPRAYATTVASMNTQGKVTPMWAAGIDYPADFETPYSRYPDIRQTPDFMAGEDARRIPVYQQTGDVASNEAWARHLDIVEK